MKLGVVGAIFFEELRNLTTCTVGGCTSYCKGLFDEPMALRRTAPHMVVSGNVQTTVSDMDFVQICR